MPLPFVGVAASALAGVFEIARVIYTSAQKASSFRQDCKQLASYVLRVQTVLSECEEQLCTAGEAAAISISEIRDVFLEAKDLVDHCSKTGRIKALIQAEDLTHKFQTISMRICNALNLLPFQQLKISRQQLDSVRGIQYELARVEYTVCKGLEQQSADLRRLVSIMNSSGDKTHSMLQQIMEMLAGQKGCKLSKEEVDGAMAELRSELDLARANKEHLEEDFMRQVISLLSSTQDTDTKPHSDQEAKDNIPKDLLCPISLELMMDPVILVESGHTYDRPNIQEWLRRGNRKDPCTGASLTQEPCLTSNITVRKLVYQWLDDHPDYNKGAGSSKPSGTIPQVPSPPSTDDDPQGGKAPELYPTVKTYTLPALAPPPEVNPELQSVLSSGSSDSSGQLEPTFSNSSSTVLSFRMMVESRHASLDVTPFPGQDRAKKTTELTDGELDRAAGLGNKGLGASFSKGAAKGSVAAAPAPSGESVLGSVPEGVVVGGVGKGALVGGTCEGHTVGGTIEGSTVGNSSKERAEHEPEHEPVGQTTCSSPSRPSSQPDPGDSDDDDGRVASPVQGLSSPADDTAVSPGRPSTPKFSGFGERADTFKGFATAAAPSITSPRLLFDAKTRGSVEQLQAQLRSSDANQQVIALVSLVDRAKSDVEVPLLICHLGIVPLLVARLLDEALLLKVLSLRLLDVVAAEGKSDVHQCMVDAGTVQAVVALLNSKQCVDDDLIFQCVSVLRSLSSTPTIRARLPQMGVLPKLTQILQATSNKVEVTIAACEVLTRLSVDAVLAKGLVEQHGLLEAIAGLMRQKDERVRTEGLLLLSQLGEHPSVDEAVTRLTGFNLATLNQLLSNNNAQVRLAAIAKLQVAGPTTPPSPSPPLSCLLTSLSLSPSHPSTNQPNIVSAPKTTSSNTAINTLQANSSTAIHTSLSTHSMPSLVSPAKSLASAATSSSSHSPGPSCRNISPRLSQSHAPERSFSPPPRAFVPSLTGSAGRHKSPAHLRASYPQTHSQGQSHSQTPAPVPTPLATWSAAAATALGLSPDSLDSSRSSARNASATYSASTLNPLDSSRSSTQDSNMQSGARSIGSAHNTGWHSSSYQAATNVPAIHPDNPPYPRPTLLYSAPVIPNFESPTSLVEQRSSPASYFSGPNITNPPRYEPMFPHRTTQGSMHPHQGVVHTHSNQGSVHNGFGPTPSFQGTNKGTAGGPFASVNASTAGAPFPTTNTSTAGGPFASVSPLARDMHMAFSAGTSGPLHPPGRATVGGNLSYTLVQVPEEEDKVARTAPAILQSLQTTNLQSLQSASMSQLWQSHVPCPDPTAPHTVPGISQLHTGSTCRSSHTTQSGQSSAQRGQSLSQSSQSFYTAQPGQPVSSTPFGQTLHTAPISGQPHRQAHQGAGPEGSSATSSYSRDVYNFASADITSVEVGNAAVGSSLRYRTSGLPSEHHRSAAAAQPANTAHQGPHCELESSRLLPQGPSTASALLTSHPQVGTWQSTDVPSPKSQNRAGGASPQGTMLQGTKTQETKTQLGDFNVTVTAQQEQSRQQSLGEMQTCPGAKAHPGAVKSHPRRFSRSQDLAETQPTDPNTQQATKTPQTGFSATRQGSPSSADSSQFSFPRTPSGTQQGKGEGTVSKVGGGRTSSNSVQYRTSSLDVSLLGHHDASSGKVNGDMDGATRLSAGPPFNLLRNSMDNPATQLRGSLGDGGLGQGKVGEQDSPAGQARASQRKFGLLSTGLTSLGSFMTMNHDGL